MEKTGHHIKDNITLKNLHLDELVILAEGENWVPIENKKRNRSMSSESENDFPNDKEISQTKMFQNMTIDWKRLEKQNIPLFDRLKRQETHNIFDKSANNGTKMLAEILLQEMMNKMQGKGRISDTSIKIIAQRASLKYPASLCQGKQHSVFLYFFLSIHFFFKLYSLLIKSTTQNVKVT